MRGPEIEPPHPASLLLLGGVSKSGGRCARYHRIFPAQRDPRLGPRTRLRSKAASARQAGRFHISARFCRSPTLHYSTTPLPRTLRFLLEPKDLRGVFCALQSSILNLPSSGCCSRVHAKCHGLSRVVSRVDAQKRPVFIDLSRCHGSARGTRRNVQCSMTKVQGPRC